MIILPIELEALASAEDYLTHFDVPFDPAVLRVSRLPMLRRFHDYLSTAVPPAGNATAQNEAVRALLLRAYTDFARPRPTAASVGGRSAASQAKLATRVFIPLAAVTGIEP
jgi:nitrogenase-stabilizing/protective protein